MTIRHFFRAHADASIFISVLNVILNLTSGNRGNRCGNYDVKILSKNPFNVQRRSTSELCREYSVEGEMSIHQNVSFECDINILESSKVTPDLADSGSFHVCLHKHIQMA